MPKYDLIEFSELEKSNQAALPNIVSDWKNELNAVDLQEVYSNISYVVGVENFLTDSTTKEINDSITGDFSDIFNVDKVAKINLKEKKLYLNFL